MHPLFALPAHLRPGRLVAGRSAESQHAHILAVALVDQAADVVPEVGADLAAALGLGRGRQRQGGRLQPLLRVVEAQDVDRVVLVALDAAERGIAGVAEHLGRAVAVHHAAVVTGDRVAQPPGDGPRRPALPGLHDRLGHLLVQPGHILLGLHGILVVLLIVAVLEQHRRRVGVRGGQEELVEVEAGQPAGQVFAESFLNPRPDDAQIARDQDRLIQRPLAVPRLQGQDVGRQAALDLAADPHGGVAGQRDGPVRRDVGRGGADPAVRPPGPARRPVRTTGRRRQAPRDRGRDRIAGRWVSSLPPGFAVGQWCVQNSGLAGPDAGGFARRTIPVEFRSKAKTAAC